MAESYLKTILNKFGRPDTPEKYLKKAEKAVKKGKFSIAAQNYEQALKLDPENFDLAEKAEELYEKGAIKAEEEGNYKQAGDMWMEAATLSRYATKLKHDSNDSVGNVGEYQKDQGMNNYKKSQEIAEEKGDSERVNSLNRVINSWEELPSRPSSLID